MVNWSKIESLLCSSSVPDEEKEQMIERLIVIDNLGIENEFAQLEHYEIVKDLVSRQLDRISYGLNYSQTDINKKLEQIQNVHERKQRG